MKIGEIVVVTSWCSVVLDIWGVIFGVFPLSAVTIFAFFFFLFSAILVGSVIAKR